MYTNAKNARNAHLYHRMSLCPKILLKMQNYINLQVKLGAMMFVKQVPLHFDNGVEKERVVDECYDNQFENLYTK